MTEETIDVEPPKTPAGAVTLVEQTSFCISAPTGDILGGYADGCFFQDTRIVSIWRLTVNGTNLEPLQAMSHEPYAATFLSRVPGQPVSLVVERTRRVGRGMHEEIVIRNMSRTAIDCDVALVVDADFADLFEVKESRVRPRGHRVVRAGDGTVGFEHEWNGTRRGVVIESPAAACTDRQLCWKRSVAGREAWKLTVVVVPTVNGRRLAETFADGQGTATDAAHRFRDWQAATPIVRSQDPRLDAVLRRSQLDLGALRIFDDKHPDRAVVAAGAPWFMALFGRDSLLSSWMALPLDQSLALGTLDTLAELQGSSTDPVTEEQPGRILHEVRLGVDTGLALGGGGIYYGTADATPLFVALIGELARWGAPADRISRLLPHADRALAWITEHGDRDGDGFVEYERTSPRGLVNQGWKDSWDGVNFADGRIAQPPIALCEVQAYVFAAYVARCHLAREAGDHEVAAAWARRAATLRREFNDRFWLPDRGYYAIALDGDKNPVDACASNMGHCLWTGIVDEDKASQVAARLSSPEMFTGWGVRTLASDMGAFDPVSYHNGSVWPHDSALVAAGLMRYGFVDEARRIARGLLDAATAFGDRLPELFCGFDRADYPEPVGYPTSCSPQAWAAATPVHLLRTLLRFEPSIPSRRVHIAPALPRRFGALHIDNVQIAGARVALDIVAESPVLHGLPGDVHVVHTPRKAVSEVV